MSTAGSAASPVWDFVRLRLLLQAAPEGLDRWATERGAAPVMLCLGIIWIGAGAFGVAMGWWRNPLQGLFTGIKLPLVLLLTAVGNALLNGMLAPLLGLNVSLRQSLNAVLMSFATASVVLGAFSPVALFVVWNTPPLGSATRLDSPEYGVLQLTLAGFVAFAGVVGNARLLPLLRYWARDAAVAWRVLLAWLAGNLFLGSQVCWVLRPFLWDPAGPTRFIGREYFRGSLYETLFEAVRRLAFP